MWVEFVVGSFPSSIGYSLGTPVLPSLQKTTFQFQFFPESEGHSFVSRKTVTLPAKTLPATFARFSQILSSAKKVARGNLKLFWLLN